MAKQIAHNITVGLFVITGMLVLIFALYLVGRNRNLFGGNFEVKARFSNLNGLVPGNNVLYAGLQAGTVKQIEIANDSTIEVTMLLDERISKHVQRNAIVSIGSEGLMGNKVINIMPGGSGSQPVRTGEFLHVQPVVSTDQMLQTLAVTNNNMAAISGNLRTTMSRISDSQFLRLLDDSGTVGDIRSGLRQARVTVENARIFVKQLNGLADNVKSGKGIAGMLFSDTSAALSLKQTINELHVTGEQLQQLTVQMNTTVDHINRQLKANTPAGILLSDSVSALHVKGILRNLDSASLSLQQNLEALKHNFLFRGYFKAQEKAKKKAARPE